MLIRCKAKLIQVGASLHGVWVLVFFGVLSNLLQCDLSLEVMRISACLKQYYLGVYFQFALNKSGIRHKNIEKVAVY